jgi:hypothetical protein
MASYRKKYASLELEDKPVTTAENVAAARLPDPVEPKPLEPPKESNPVEQAAQAEISKRLAEMKQASEMAAGPQPQQPQSPPRADGGIEDMIREWPERAKEWVRDNPDLVLDPKQFSRLQDAHDVAVRETGSQSNEAYHTLVEHLIGYERPEPPPQPSRRALAAPPPRSSGPAVNYSAPPTREAPSWSTGRPMSESTVRLTDEDRANARMWGLTDQQMLEGKQRLAREKSAGMHQHG